MRLLFCSERYSSGIPWEDLSSLLPSHEIIACSRDAVIDHLEGVDVLIPFAASISRSIIERGTFGLIHEFAVGLDTVDVEAATATGIWVAHLPASTTGNADSVAELTLLHMLLLARHWKETQGTFEARRLWEPPGSTLLGKTVCLVGLGDVGTVIAKRLTAFGMRLVGVRRHPEQGGPAALPFQQIAGLDTFHELLHEADYVMEPAGEEVSACMGRDERAIPW